VIENSSSTQQNKLRQKSANWRARFDFTGCLPPDLPADLGIVVDDSDSLSAIRHSCRGRQSCGTSSDDKHVKWIG
jgi:hypothetical protein